MKSTASSLIRIVVASLVLLMLQAAFVFLLPASARQANSNFVGALAHIVLTAAVMIDLARRLQARGAKAALILWGIWGGIQANYLVEGVLFDIGIPRADMAWLALQASIVSGAFSVFAGLSFARNSPQRGSEHREMPAWWRLLLCSPLYVVLYFTAGMLAWPYVKEFYVARPMPSLGPILALQFVRGVVFGSIVLLIVRHLRASRVSVALTAGLTLSILGGVAPLLASNPYLPDAVRLAHLPEVGISNFVLGAMAAWLLDDRREQRTVVTMPQ